MERLVGTIVRVQDTGLAYVRADSLYAFTFDRIRGYRGEYPHELREFSPRGLRPGVMVSYTLERGSVGDVAPAWTPKL